MSFSAGTVSTASHFLNPSFPKTVEPTKPESMPQQAASDIASRTVMGLLNANGARKPGMGAAVPGALLTMPRATATMPDKPPPKKLLQKIGMGFFVTMSA